MPRKDPGIGKLELRQEAPASPERVIAMARYIQQLLEAAHPSLPEGSVTMIITNYSLGAEARARTPEARDALALITSLMERPGRVVSKHPEARQVLRALANVSSEIRDAKVMKPRRRRPIATLDSHFIGRMRELAESGEDTSLRGTTSVYTRVLRVGRLAEGGDVRARIEVNGKAHDVVVSDAASVKAFFDAARDGTIVKVRLDTVFERYGDGTLHPTPQRTRAIAVETWDPISGRELLETVNPDAFDFDDLLEDLNRQ